MRTDQVFNEISRFVYSKWGFLSGFLIGLLVMIGTRYWPFGDDSDSWAGLGQWMGGFGAFSAAWAALRIARKEVTRANRREAERARVQAFYVKVSQLQTTDQGVRVQVENRGDTPIIDVDVVAIHIHLPSEDRRVPCAATGGKRSVLLREDGLWEPWAWPADGEVDETIAAMTASNGNTEIEIEFNDVGGTRWHRIGSRPPEQTESGRPSSRRIGQPVRKALTS
ncbi:hypothetical protein ABZ342_00300 [Amycolatopsis sp. NPDC005961]|uniref:hypothetical protein n=1 Tax=Amycolatopsis sp. NPDC005961 TaxID=3156720 RepID=UPI0033E09888